ncbi:hypothetical protein ACFYRC_37270 [Streptomyces sp. NPDC005279]|uniref:hypothetical protein n=1 Tax=Streptomyces sp. NPDC005279 TaxID=3364712 RepID=UPI0036A46409
MDAVRRYDILDTPPDGAYDRVATLAARLFDAPVTTVTIVDTDRIASGSRPRTAWSCCQFRSTAGPVSELIGDDSPYAARGPT